MSDGSSTIYQVDPKKWEMERKITVHRASGEKIDKLNELEIVADKWIFANMFTTNKILQIEIGSGLVLAEWDLSALLARQNALLKY